MKTKILFTFIMLLTSTLLFAQNITLSLENAAITNDGVDDFYEVDVFLESDTDYVQGVGLFYMDYNAAAFGMNVVDSGDPDRFEFQRTAGSLLASQTFGVDNYNQFGSANNGDTTLAVSWQQFWSSGTIGVNVTSTPTLLGHFRIRFTNSSEMPNLCFNVVGPSFDDEFYTACGPFAAGPAGADCTGDNAGTQILDYTPDCTGTMMACSDVVTYTAGGWMPAPPTSTSTVVFEASYNSETDGGSVEACEVTVDMGVTLTIAAGDYLNVQNDITVDGILNVLHQGSVVQVEDDGIVTNNGVINVNVTTPTLGGRDFMIMGSPVSVETREAVLGGANKVRQHLTAQFELNQEVTVTFGDAINFADENLDGTTVNWINHTGTLNPGEGYWVRPQTNGAADATYDYVFNAGTSNAGTLNTGDITFTTVIGPDGAGNGSPNIVANPYPSAISATAFMANNGLTEIYFWEHNTQPNASFPGQYTADFTMGDISMINSAGVGNPAATGGATPTNVLASMQGFGFKAPDADVTTFTNAMRLTDNNNTLRNGALEQDIVRLHVMSTSYERGATTTVAFLEEATQGFDEGLDSRRLANIVSLYTHLEDGSYEFGIQSREAFTDNVKIPVGFSTLIEEETNYIITRADIQGANLTAATAYLIDNYKGTVTNLNETDYEFSSNVGRFDMRFTLQFKNEDILNTSEVDLENISIYPNPTNGILHIISPKEVITGVTIYDLPGRIISDVLTEVEGDYTADFTR